MVQTDLAEWVACRKSLPFLITNHTPTAYTRLRTFLKPRCRKNFSSSVGGRGFGLRPVICTTKARSTLSTMCARLSWASRQLLSARKSIVSYRSNRQLCCLLLRQCCHFGQQCRSNVRLFRKDEISTQKLVRHFCHFWQQSRMLLRHCCWCGRGFSLYLFYDITVYGHMFTTT